MFKLFKKNKGESKFEKLSNEYQLLKKDHDQLIINYNELKRIQQEKARKEEQYKLLEREVDDLIFQNNQLREELSLLKGISDDTINSHRISDGAINLKSTGPRYTNLGNEALRIDKFPGKIGYIPKEKK